MKGKSVVIGRLVFGLGFVIFGLNGFFHFMPNPPMSQSAGELMGAFAKTGYFFPMIKFIEILIGIFLLSNFLVPLALTIIFPILVGITSIHLFLNPAGLPMLIVLHAIHGFLVYSYREFYKSLVTLKAQVK